MKVQLDARPKDAVNCVKLIAWPTDPERRDYGFKTGETALFQTDQDWPYVAGLFGWVPRMVQNAYDVKPEDRCDHPSTNGTLDCDACGVKAGAFISAAKRWIDKLHGSKVDMQIDECLVHFEK